MVASGTGGFCVVIHQQAAAGSDFGCAIGDSGHHGPSNAMLPRTG
jgi:hypothetical protein